MNQAQRWQAYFASLKGAYQKLSRLDFLNADGTISFTVDNNEKNRLSHAFIQDGSLTVNLQNGARRAATVLLDNEHGDFDYSVNKLWFGQQVRLSMGLKLPDGTDFYIPQGVFYIQNPEEELSPDNKQVKLNLVDKWSYLDGTLFGRLDGIYEVPYGTNIFDAIKGILLLPRGDGHNVDNVSPLFTEWYNGKTQALPDGTNFPLTSTPYTYRCDDTDGTYSTVILSLNEMLAGWIGYNAAGQLQLDPSQDDILDSTKPILWQFTPKEKQFLGATYTVKNTDVYNDIIIKGESLDDYAVVAARATNYDPKSDTNANLIGLKTKIEQASGYYTTDVCQSLANFRLKRQAVLQKSVTIQSSQMFHLIENNLVTIQRPDKNGAIERHLVTGFAIPITETGAMEIQAVSTFDFPSITETKPNY